MAIIYRYPVLAEKDEELKIFRLKTIYFAHHRLNQALGLLGIQVPDKM